MAGKLGRSKDLKVYRYAHGSLATRPTDELIEDLSKNKIFYTVAQNVENYKLGAIKKATGWTANANRPDASTAWMSQAVPNSTPYSEQSSGTFTAICFKVTPGSTRKALCVTLATLIWHGLDKIKVILKADNAGSPGTTVTNSTSSEIVFRQETDKTQSTPFTGYTRYIWNSIPQLTSGTPYWVCVEFYRETRDGSVVSGLTSKFGLTRNNGLVTASDVKITTNDYSSFTNDGANGYPYFSLESSTVPMQGLYDVLSESGGTIGQEIVAFQGGALYAMTDPANPTTSAWDAALTGATGLGNDINKLGDYVTLNNLHFFSDYSTNIQRVWDAAASYTMQQGFRPTFSLAQSASAGGPWSAAGLVKVIGVVTMSSGGFRATAIGSITLSGTTQKIDISSITNSIGAATDLGFDAGLLNMAWYITIPNGSIYYKVPAASISGGAGTNPNTNATNFSILPTTDSVLQAGGTLDLNLGIPQAAFTSQVVTPKFKFMEVFASCLVGAGDPDNPSRVWFSWQGGPQIFSTYGKVYGNYIDINPEDGQIITGLQVADGRLYIGKGKTLYFIDYTQNANDPFSNARKVHGQEGVQSHWTMTVMPKGLWYLSPQGPAICYGTYSQLDPEAAVILNLFDAGDPNRLNMASMAFSTSVNYEDRNQIWTTIASSSTSGLRDQYLVYDYAQGKYWIAADQPCNVLAMISDANGNKRLCSGSYYGKFLRKNIDSDTDAYFSDQAAIYFIASTANLGFSDEAGWKEGGYLEISGPVQSDGQPSRIYVDFFKDGSTNVAATSVINPMLSEFATGIAIQIPFIFKNMKLRFRTLPYAGPIEMDMIRFEYTDTGVRR